MMDDNQPFVERLTQKLLLQFAYSFIKIQSQAPMQSFAWCDTKAHWSPEALAQRKINRKIYFDTAYPEHTYIFTKVTGIEDLFRNQKREI
jgi:hypothetical protein